MALRTPDTWIIINLVCLLLASTAAVQAGDTRWTGRCEKVIDGDTIVVKKERSNVEVDLAGIDSPELGQEFGKEAREFTTRLLQGKIVTVIVELGSGSEVKGRVEVYGKDASLLIVQEGWAWYYPRIPTDQRLVSAEQQAKKGYLGLWVNNLADPPWFWRLGNRPIPLF